MDQESIGMLAGGFIEECDQTNYWWVVPGARDKGNGANVAFADGSTTFHKWLFPGRTRTCPQPDVQNAGDFADLVWLQGVYASVREP